MGHLDEHQMIMDHLETIVKSTDEMKEHLKTLNGKVYSHEQMKADRVEVGVVKTDLVDFIKSVEANAAVTLGVLKADIKSVDEKANQNRTYIWKMSLLIAGGAAGGYGIAELVKTLFGG